MMVKIPIILYRFFKFKNELFKVSWSFVNNAAFIFDENRYKYNDMKKYTPAKMR